MKIKLGKKFRFKEGNFVVTVHDMFEYDDATYIYVRVIKDKANMEAYEEYYDKKCHEIYKKRPLFVKIGLEVLYGETFTKEEFEQLFEEVE